MGLVGLTVADVSFILRCKEGNYDFYPLDSVKRAFKLPSTDLRESIRFTVTILVFALSSALQYFIIWL